MHPYLCRIILGIFFIVIFLCTGKFAKRPAAELFRYLFLICGALLAVCNLLQMLLLRFWGLSAQDLVRVRYAPSEDLPAITTTAATVLSTLTTVDLALIALVVTAYVFLIGTLEHRESYEQYIIRKMCQRQTRQLIVLSGFTGICVVLSLICDNSLLTVPYWIQYCLVAAMLVDTVWCIVFIYQIINYEDKLAQLAKQELLQEGKENGKENTSEGLSEGKVTKGIGDLENIVKRIVDNHTFESGYHQNQKVLADILANKAAEHKESQKTGWQDTAFNAKDVSGTYSTLLNKRNCLWMLQHFGQASLSDKESEVIVQLDRERETIWNTICRFSLANEQLRDISLSDVRFPAGSDLSNTTFHSSALSAVILDGATLSGADFSDSLLQSVSMKDAVCEDAIFRDVKFIHATLPKYCKNSVFSRAVFNDTNIRGEKDNALLNYQSTAFRRANLIAQEISYVDFSYSFFDKALLSAAKIKDCCFNNAKLTGAVLANTEIDGRERKDAGFQKANMEDISAPYSKWTGVSFEGSRLAHGNFSEAKLSDCCLSACYINNASFINANLECCKFDSSLLNGTDFSFAIMKNCTFRDCDLRKSLFDGQRDEILTVENTDFSYANFTGAQIKNCVFKGCTFAHTFFDEVMLKNVRFVCCSFPNAQFHHTVVMDVTWKNCIGLRSAKDVHTIRFCGKRDQLHFTESQRIYRKMVDSYAVKDAIFQRKSTRSFVPDLRLERADLECILRSGLQAPSPKNRQPWKFCVVEDQAQKQRLTDIMMQSIAQLKQQRIQKNRDISDLTMAEYSAEILSQASAVIFVCYERDPSQEHDDPLAWDITAQGFEVADLQAIGAAVENMLLQATELSIDSLWICDVLYAHDALRSYLHLPCPFVAAVALGKVAPHQSNRKELHEKVIWNDTSAAR